MGVSAPQGHGVAHSTEELQIQIQQARERGLLAPGEEKFIVSAIELGQVQVREIMVPRPDMHTLPVESTLDEVMRAFATTQRSRIPVYRGTVDHILGFVHIKDMLWILLDRERRAARRAAAATVRFAPGVARSAYRSGNQARQRIAGGTSRAATSDWRWWWTNSAAFWDWLRLKISSSKLSAKFTMSLTSSSRPLTLVDGAVIFDAALNVRDLDAQYNIPLPEDPAYATVGGFVLDQLGFIPRGGESFIYGDLRFTVVEMDGKRVARVKVERSPPESPSENAAQRLRNDNSQKSRQTP